MRATSADLAELNRKAAEREARSISDKAAELEAVGYDEIVARHVAVGYVAGKAKLDAEHTRGLDALADRLEREAVAA